MTNDEKRFAFVAGAMLLLFHIIAALVAIATHNATMIVAFLIADVAWIGYKVAQGIAMRLWP